MSLVRYFHLLEPFILVLQRAIRNLQNSTSTDEGCEGVANIIYSDIKLHSDDIAQLNSTLEEMINKEIELNKELKELSKEYERLKSRKCVSKYQLGTLLHKIESEEENKRIMTCENTEIGRKFLALREQNSSLFNEMINLSPQELKTMIINERIRRLSYEDM
ncbi:uncharacterized protein LOC130667933 [Microplitis mediator]|uniref:uncharacterized protein LOC130667933 n=1 Tax=Microplitis mediator TaxID=375433 RepID=UPI0025567491|nr:uncharacterized protein LOC130667933 [Microplitis mediator]